MEFIVMTDQSLNKTPNTNSRVIMLGTIIVAVVGGAIVLFALFSRPADKNTPAQSDDGAAIIEGDAFTGVEPVDPPRQLQAWTLTSKDNKPFSLSDLKGKMALILFGYTHCPDVCPGTMLDYKKIK